MRGGEGRILGYRYGGGPVYAGNASGIIFFLVLVATSRMLLLRILSEVSATAAPMTTHRLRREGI
jgi:hypothetical protein